MKPADPSTASSAPPETKPIPAAELSHSVAAGALVPVELKSVVDSATMVQGFIVGIVTDDVKGTDGRTAIPAGSAVTIFVRGVGRKGPISEIDMGLYAVNVQGRESTLTTGPKDAASVTFTEDAGKGPAHSAVHLNYGYRVDFKLDTAIQLR